MWTCDTTVTATQCIALFSGSTCIQIYFSVSPISTTAPSLSLWLSSRLLSVSILCSACALCTLQLSHFPPFPISVSLCTRLCLPLSHSPTLSISVCLRLSISASISLIHPLSLSLSLSLSMSVSVSASYTLLWSLSFVLILSVPPSACPSLYHRWPFLVNSLNNLAL